MSSSSSSGPQRVTAPNSEPSAALRGRVAAALSEGSLVVLPTETVYGIAARADSERAMQALSVLKCRPRDQGWTWHVGDAQALERFDAPSGLARRLTESCWPGPLTLVLPGVPPGLERAARDGWTGVRCVSHALTGSLLAGLDFPVVMTSANPRGASPASDADAAASATGTGIDLLVDAGPARGGAASSVLRLGRSHFELLREGPHDLDGLRRAAGLRIGLACTGNTCRSPMAEGLAGWAIARRLETEVEHLAEFGFHLRSMGVFAGDGAPASSHAVEACRVRGIDIADHCSRGVHANEVADLQRIYCMTRAHVDALRLLLGRTGKATIELLDSDGEDIPDPIGGSLHDYQHCAEHISGCIAARIDEWA
ncbi:MAG TPA: Sua5/YciO/YrdC/YwlC family protein [Planctomycetota bacterium]|nr:Sua5/YciO/YrdC/YwlC family protein [Planctomycetota bacterium]